MSIVLAAADPSILSFSGTVTEIDGRDVELDQTYFYPEGGGQPADRGQIDGIPVADVQSTGDRIAHSLDSEPEFSIGDTIRAQIDPAFRAYCQRIHTASHVVYGAGRRLFDELGYGGFGIDEEKARIDFETPNPIETKELVELERLANWVVWEHREVSWEVLPAEEALNREGIAFNTKTEEGAAGDEIRVVEIDEWDVAACGGTHVANTKNIGPISILDRSNPGEGLTRIELTVGPNGITHRANEKEALRTAAEMAGTAPETLRDKLQEYDSTIEELEQRQQELKTHLLEAWQNQLSESVVTEDKTSWLVARLDSPESDLLAECARTWVGDSADVIVLVEPSTRPSVVIATTGQSASEIIDSLVGEFGGGGGGSETFAQAGGLDASPEQILAYVEDTWLKNK